MKRLFLAMLALMLVTSTAYAFDAQITGSYYVRGTYVQTDFDYDFEVSDGEGGMKVAIPEEGRKATYDHELDMDATINTDENTYVKFGVETRDETMNKAADQPGFVTEYVYLGHKFGTGTTVEAGDMNAPLYWGTDFGS